MMAESDRKDKEDKKNKKNKKDIIGMEDADNVKSMEHVDHGKENKDVLEKILLLYSDVFVDCENSLFYGEKRLEADEMQLAPTESFYPGKKRRHSQFADVSFFRMEDGIAKMQYFIENETGKKKRQVLRKASYQGGMYRAQLESRDPVYPVSGIVLDWTRKSARIPASLHELLTEEGASREDINRVDDVKLNIFHMRHLSKEVRNRFVSDMGFVVDYLNEGTLEGRKAQKILHVEALCEMMAALTGDNRFTELIEELQKRQREGGKIIMCEYIDMLEARGEARGMIKGEEIGIAKGERLGIAKGEKLGMVKGENRLSALLIELYSLGRDEDAKLAVSDKDVRTRLYREFSIA